jgi:hypothetical protein
MSTAEWIRTSNETMIMEGWLEWSTNKRVIDLAFAISDGRVPESKLSRMDLYDEMRMR